MNIHTPNTLHRQAERYETRPERSRRERKRSLGGLLERKRSDKLSRRVATLFWDAQSLFLTEILKLDSSSGASLTADEFRFIGVDKRIREFVRARVAQIPSLSEADRDAIEAGFRSIEEQLLSALHDLFASGLRAVCIDLFHKIEEIEDGRLPDETLPEAVIVWSGPSSYCAGMNSHIHPSNLAYVIAAIETEPFVLRQPQDEEMSSEDER